MMKKRYFANFIYGSREYTESFDNYIGAKNYILDFFTTYEVADKYVKEFLQIYREEKNGCDTCSHYVGFPNGNASIWCVHIDYDMIITNLKNKL